MRVGARVCILSKQEGFSCRVQGRAGEDYSLISLVKHFSTHRSLPLNDCCVGDLGRFVRHYVQHRYHLFVVHDKPSHVAMALIPLRQKALRCERILGQSLKKYLSFQS